MNDFTEMMKKIDPEYKTHCEETLTMNREKFNQVVIDCFKSANGTVMEMLALGKMATDLWDRLKGK